ncbi:MAG TPA: hypothetical protein VGM90_31485 [Kofleriaceae bacterium]|jgi:hypothetical protein
MIRFAFAAALLAGCFPHPSDNYECSLDTECTSDRFCGPAGFCLVGARDDGGTDSGSGSGSLCMQFPARHFDACMIPEPTDPLNLSMAGEYKYDTGSGMLTDPGNNMTTPLNKMVGDFRVLSVKGLSIAAGATLRVTGTAPFVVASWEAIDIAGTVDISSVALVRGAGSSPSTCTARAAASGTAHGQGGDGAGGGGNATAGGRGGLGGTGNNGASANTGNGAGLGGTALATLPLLAGGCDGAKGAAGSTMGGVGGFGGGALQLTARTAITIQSSGRINAGGGGGQFGVTSTTGGGGGGGGAGGMIGLEAPTVTTMAGAILAANGGGGGQGGGGAAGTAGQDAQVSATAAAGGTGGAGGVGGAGSTTAAGGDGHEDGAGAGAGGGGAGYIAIKGTHTAGATYSPSITVVP